MRADLSRDPDELDRIAHLLSDLAGDLTAAGAAGPGAPRRIADELDAVAAALAGAAASGRAADAEAAVGLRAASPGPGPWTAGGPGSGTSGRVPSPNPLTR